MYNIRVLTGVILRSAASELGASDELCSMSPGLCSLLRLQDRLASERVAHEADTFPSTCVHTFSHNVGFPWPPHRIIARLQEWRTKLVQTGFQELVFEDALDALLQQVCDCVCVCVCVCL